MFHPKLFACFMRTFSGIDFEGRKRTAHAIHSVPLFSRLPLLPGSLLDETGNERVHSSDRSLNLLMNHKVNSPSRVEIDRWTDDSTDLILAFGIH